MSLSHNIKDINKKIKSLQNQQKQLNDKYGIDKTYQKQIKPYKEKQNLNEMDYFEIEMIQNNKQNFYGHEDMQKNQNNIDKLAAYKQVNMDKISHNNDLNKNLKISLNESLNDLSQLNNDNHLEH